MSDESWGKGTHTHWGEGTGPVTRPGAGDGRGLSQGRGAGVQGWALCSAKASGSVGFCKYLNTGRIIFGGYGLSPGLAGCRAGCRVTAGSPHTPTAPAGSGFPAATATASSGSGFPLWGQHGQTEALWLSPPG